MIKMPALPADLKPISPQKLVAMIKKYAPNITDIKDRINEVRCPIDAKPFRTPIGTVYSGGGGGGRQLVLDISDAA